VLRHGFEPIAAKAGYDIRVTPDVAVAPFVGADLNVFVWQSLNNTSNTALHKAQLGTFLYAGLQGRFDIGGTRYDPEAPIPSMMGVTAPQPQAPTPLPPPPVVEETKPVSPSIAVSEDVMRDCMLNIDSLEKAPKFEYNKSELKEADIAVLTQIGACFSTGPLKDATMHLVGRADPRGSLAYNDALGMRRANEVATFLEQRGVDAGRIQKTSLGKREARGHDEETWKMDRRVDVLLGK
jgi:peptidoglycan-associated lipoprotein